MAGMAEQAIQRAIQAYTTRDLSICEQVFKAEPAINRLEREIDQMALDLLAMEQPMAIDLRFILSVIRINADLERVGDQAVNIAVRVREMGAFANIDLPVDIPKLASLASAMVRKALRGVYRGGCGACDFGAADGRSGGRDERCGVLFAELADQGETGVDAAIFECADHFAEPGTGWGSCHEHRRGCDFLGSWSGCSA